jgi:carbamoyl-phosphate synthase small subunit
MYKKGYLALEDGSYYEGFLIGTGAESIGEVVFNTGMTGYQETLTDPSYLGQIVMMTYPLIGNYGINEEYSESDESWVKGFIVSDLCDEPSNWSSRETLNEFMIRKGVTGLTGVDIRAITRKTREYGTMRGMICSELPDEKDMSKIKAYDIVDAVKTVTVKEKFIVKGGPKGNIALIDLGVKKDIIVNLNSLGYDVTVYPSWTSAEEILSAGHSGVMLTNGPGDPKENVDVIANIRKLIGNIPVFGICLGHQLTALAMGGNTYKLKYGHRGGNHPVRDLESGEVYLTSQNHGYAVDDKVPVGGGEIRQINLNDMTVEGVNYTGKRAFTVQFHPEACAGPLDSRFLFQKFADMIEKDK